MLAVGDMNESRAAEEGKVEKTVNFDNFPVGVPLEVEA